MWFFGLVSRLNGPILRNSKDSAGQIISLDDRSSLDDLMENFDTIRKEALDALPYAKPIQGDLFFGESLTDDGRWKRVYLKWYSKPSKLAEKLFPKTLAIMAPHSDIRLAMISILEPGAVIKPHSGVWAGSIRVHIALEAPDDENCFINVGGIKYVWKTGELVAFNDTYPHFVMNNTNKRRVVLFLDVERKMKNRFWQFIVWAFNTTVARATSRE